MEFRRYVALDKYDHTITQNEDLTELVRSLLNSGNDIGDIKIRALYMDDNMNRIYMRI